MARQDPLIGKQLGNYRIERLLGQGGMARVYYGWDVRLHRPVAIKVIDDQSGTDSSSENRFIREARAVATWNHPNILQVYTAGEEGGFPYFAMEFIQGMDLGQLLRRYAQAGKLMPHADVIAIARAVANALDFAHRKGVIHRDVKPSNVLISEDDRVVLSDFGLAMIVTEGTMGEVFGSPLYMAPEQARNSANAVPQSDLYSLGVMLYEMMVGVPPFNDHSPASLAIKHIVESPPPPREINPAITPAVEAVLLKSLRKKPEERYASAGEMVAALEEAINAGQETDEHNPLIQPDLPGTSGTLTPETLSYVLAAGGTVMTLDELPPLTPPVPAMPSRKGEKTPSPVRKWAGFGIGCLALFIFGAAALGLSIALAVSRQAGSPLAGLNRRTPTPSQGSSLALTITSRAAEPSATLHLSIPSATMQLFTPSRTASSTPLPPYELTFFLYKDEILFIIFHGPEDFQVRDLVLKGEKGIVWGEDWQVESIQDGECVSIWKEKGKDKGKSETPKDLDCTVVGERLAVEPSEQIWAEPFEVYYDNQLVGECRSASTDDSCRVKITR